MQPGVHWVMHWVATDWMVSGPHSPARPLTEDRSCLFQRCHLLFTQLVLFCHLDDLLVASATFCEHPILDICHRQSKDFLVDPHWTAVYCSPSTFGLFLLRPRYPSPYATVENCHDRWSFKILASWVNLCRKQCGFLQILNKNTNFTHTKCDFALILLKFYTWS